MPTNGSKVRTPQPLAPYSSYRIKITSPYSLKPVYSEGDEAAENDVQIDGKLLKAISFEQGADGHVSNLEFIYRGYGKPITIGFGKDHYQELESAQVHIYPEKWTQRLWRERFAGIWGGYAEWIIASLILLPFVGLAGVQLNRRYQKNKSEERKAERERQAVILNSHNKSLEVMREIDRRAQQKAQEIMAKNFDDLQKKIMYWRTRAYTESYFLNPELRQNYAMTNREKIINELENKWSQEFLEIAQDLPLAQALRDQEPGVMHWIMARQDVINLAHSHTWTAQPVIDAYYEIDGEGSQIIAVESEETETATRR
jgi:hypothetical protein